MFVRGGYRIYHSIWGTFEREGAAGENHAGGTNVNSTAPGNWVRESVGNQASP